MYNPLVSVIIPSYNSINYISESVDSALNQNYKRIEVIIIDDGSIDGCYELICKKYTNDSRVKILTHPNRENKGVVASRRLGIESSKGQFIAFLDADDIFFENKLTTQLNIFYKYPDVVLVHSCAILKSEINTNEFNNNFTYSNSDRKYNLNLQEFIHSNHICNSSVLVKRKFLINLKSVPNQTFQYEDWIQWVLISEYGPYYYLSEPTCIYRYHSMASTASLVKNKKLSLYAHFEMMLILYTIIRDKKKFSQIRTHLFTSLNKVYSNLFLDQQLDTGFYFFGLFQALKIKVKKKIKQVCFNRK